MNLITGGVTCLLLATTLLAMIGCISDGDRVVKALPSSSRSNAPEALEQHRSRDILSDRTLALIVEKSYQPKKGLTDTAYPDLMLTFLLPGGDERSAIPCFDSRCNDGLARYEPGDLVYIPRSPSRLNNTEMTILSPGEIQLVEKAVLKPSE